MSRTILAVIAIAFMAGSVVFGSRSSAQVNSNDNNIAVMDNCDPSDPGWNATGGCALRRGTVSTAEFGALLFSPNQPGFPIGHPSWRNEPSYITTPPGRSVRVTNWGGRLHTFTEVTNFGGGFVPQLNGALLQAPECNPTTVVQLPAGATQILSPIGVGTHKYQCCIHPWMRASIEVH
jgi:plastocyanin